jgi:hypothetical protein
MRERRAIRALRQRSGRTPAETGKNRVLSGVLRPEAEGKLPAGGVTLTYPPDSGGDPRGDFSDCVNEFGPPSVGGYYYGGPYFADLNGADLSYCLPPAIAAAVDVWRAPTPGHPGATYVVNPKHDRGVTLGFGSDKKIYFAYNDSASNARTIFGYLRNLSDRTSANVSSVSGLTLGNDGSLWFSGVSNAKAVIGKLPPRSFGTWNPYLFSVPTADEILSIEPGIGHIEVFLYSAQGKIYVGKINTDFSGFTRIRVLTNSASPGFGDLLAGPNNNFYASAGGDVYRISSSGVLSIVCSHVQKIDRLSDGTGVGYRQPQSETELHAVVHLVPADNGCTTIPVFPYETGLVPPFGDLFGVDSTTDDWIMYSNPHGHRRGIF